MSKNQLPLNAFVTTYYCGDEVLAKVIAPLEVVSTHTSYRALAAVDLDVKEIYISGRGVHADLTLDPSSDIAHVFRPREFLLAFAFNPDSETCHIVNTSGDRFCEYHYETHDELVARYNTLKSVYQTLLRPSSLNLGPNTEPETTESQPEPAESDHD